MSRKGTQRGAGGELMARRFVKIWKKLNKLVRGKLEIIHVYLTPKGSPSHTKVGTMDGNMSVIVIPGHTEMYIPVERAALEEGIPRDSQECSVQVKIEDVIRAMNFYDVHVGCEEKAEKAWKKMLPKGFSQTSNNIRKILGNPPRSKRETELEENIKKLERKNDTLERRANNHAGQIIEMQMAGLIPMFEEPPFKIEYVDRIHYGCDWLIQYWEGDILNRCWIESNLSRTSRKPRFTENETKYFDAGIEGRIKDHYIHHYVDKKGKPHYEFYEDDDFEDGIVF